jgi:hypothetical protein
MPAIQFEFQIAVIQKYMVIHMNMLLNVSNDVARNITYLARTRIGHGLVGQSEEFLGHIAAIDVSVIAAF